MAATGTPWFRLYSQLRTHPKLDDLAARLGVPKTQALGHLVMLWCWATDYAPDGNLIAFSLKAIENGSQWEGTEGKWIKSLRGARLLDGKQIHNRLVYAESYNRAKSKRVPRQSPDSSTTVDTQSVHSPPERRGEERRGEETEKRVAPVPIGQTKKADTVDVLEVFNRWRAHHADEYMMPHGGLKEWRAISDRLALDGCSPDKLWLAIDGIHKDDWEDRARNLSLWHVVKDLASVQRFAAMAKPAAPKRFGQTPVKEPEKELTDEENETQRAKNMAAVRKLSAGIGD